MQQAGTLLGASYSLLQDGRPILSILVFMTTIALPLLSLFGILYLLIAARLGKYHHYNAALYRVIINVEVWGMLEVFLLAIIVAGVKLGDVAEVIPGLSLYSFVIMILVLTYLQFTLNHSDIWDKREVHI